LTPGTLQQQDATFFPASGSDAAAIQTDGLFNIVQSGSNATFDDFTVIVNFGDGSATPDFPTYTSTGSASIDAMTSMDAFSLITLYSQVGSANSTVTGLYISTGGTVDVTSIGSAGATFTASVASAAYEHINFTISGNNIEFGSAAADGCKTAIATASTTAKVGSASGFEGESVPLYHFGSLHNRTR
jgi:hypothetical protein